MHMSSIQPSSWLLCMKCACRGEESGNETANTEFQFHTIFSVFHSRDDLRGAIVAGHDVGSHVLGLVRSSTSEAKVSYLLGQVKSFELYQLN